MSPTIKFADQATGPAERSVYTRTTKKPKMSLTQTYYLAHSARGKLSKEASRADHDLRLLVGHANMLDCLMIDLANAEQEQERWFNQSVNGATIEAEEEEDEEASIEENEIGWEAEDADTDSEDEEAEEDLSLTRTRSHSRSPPELTVDADSDSEDEHMPSSPPDEKLDATMTEKQRQAIATTSFYNSSEVSMSTTEAESFEEEGFFIPSRSQPILIAAN